MALAFWAAPAAAVDCRNIAYDDNRYTICEVDVTKDELRLFLKDGAGDVYGHFSAIETDLADKGQTLPFATNAGMYHRDRSPVGLYRDGDEEEMRLITTPGPGNFGLLPNGVLCIGAARTDVIETLTFAETNPPCAALPVPAERRGGRLFSVASQVLAADRQWHRRLRLDR